MYLSLVGMFLVMQGKFEQQFVICWNRVCGAKPGLDALILAFRARCRSGDEVIVPANIYCVRTWDYRMGLPHIR